MTQNSPTPELTVHDFDFHLPEELIAQQPPAQRGSSRMLVVHRESCSVPIRLEVGPGFIPGYRTTETDGALAPEVGISSKSNEQDHFLEDKNFHDLPSLLNPGDLLVLNDSRVIPARLYARRANARGKQDPTGQIEVLLTAPDAAGNWSALVRPGRKVRTGDTLEFFAESGGSSTEGAGALMPLNQSQEEIGLSPGTPVLRAQVLASGQFGERTLQFEPVPDFYAALEQIGHIPLPPYIKRDDQTTDRERYQTVFAHDRGSVAAPTAGLHFTPEILAEIAARGVEIVKITLHVGLGTFAPLRAEKLSEIQLHRERYTLSQPTAEALNRARLEGRRIVAVGTTTVRTLEHVARESHGKPFQPHTGETQIFIAPGHQFQLVDAMLTNFHLPQSSLLMLVSAFASRECTLAAYQHAVQQKYRFFSYGDCMFLC
jgi:S-adenosylmethionine:tRNA ribosyltransferase-isomerase